MSKPGKTITIYVTPDARRDMESLASAWQMSRTQAIREAIKLALAREGLGSRDSE